VPIARAAHEKGSRLEAFDYGPAPLGPHDVEVAISRWGICHGDVHLVDGDWGVRSYPMVPEHVVSTVFVSQDWPRLIGAPAEPLSLPICPLIGAQRSVAGSAIGGRPAIREMLDFAARHGVRAQGRVRPMAEADAALAELHQGRARYRTVLAT
jgi:D-arabinose 1-dehydrogenase-like Zn-dependent alcohol dehydrogenase